MNNYWFLGAVKNDQLQLLRSEQDLPEQALHGICRLTTQPTNTSEPPATGEIPLIQYNESAIMIRGIYKEGWIYSAIVIEQAGPILTLVAQALFGRMKTV